jgi:threonine aldolase
MNYEKEIVIIVKKFEGKLPPEDIKSIISLAEHSEWGQALDNLCTQIEEYNLFLSMNTFSKIEEMVREMNLDVVDLDALKSLIR